MAPTEPGSAGVAAIVLGEVPARRRRLLLAAAFAAAAAHVGVALAALGLAAPLPAPARPPARVLRVDHVVELDPPAASAPPAHVERRASREASPRPAPSAAAPAPAQAGAVVAAEETSAQPVEFAEIVAGAGPGYAGGVTAPNGTSASAVHAAHVDPLGRPGGTGAASRARAVGAPVSDWNCPWPVEAEELSVEEEVVVLRVVVRADGVVADVEVVTDPGHGFGRVARACARAYRFPPALDETGRPVLATSPPLRVTFTRP